ncbi:MAG: hypothetical protein D0528_06305 [Methylococcales bacterium]|nr:MAG: hypothetical protein D0528_06305 [Methylococcales bacterium]
MAKKTIVVLANSIKHSQHCVAGKCINTKEWIRLVSDKFGAELTHQQARYQNPYGTYLVKPMQKTVVGLDQHVPLIHQPENHIIDGSIWQQQYNIDDTGLHNYLETPNDLWGSGDHILYSDITNGYITIVQSLYLVKVNNLNIYKNQYDKRRASFNYNNQNYDFAVTDPNFDSIVNNGVALKNILCLSLGEEYKGNCYKLVATIF